MSQEFGDPPVEQKSLSWIEVFISAITKPSLENYERLIRDPNATANRAYLWLFIASTVTYGISYFLWMLVPNILNSGYVSSFGSGGVFSPVNLLFLCCAPIVGVMWVVEVAVLAGLTQIVARLLGGAGSYSKLVYAMAAYTVPLSFIISIVAIIPQPFVVLCILLPLSIYTLVLNVTAVNAVNQFGWGKAIVSALIVPLTLTVLVTCGVIFILALLGSQIGDVFSEIIRAMETPGSMGA